ncbi:hypothetical protein BJY52DRAFT_1229915 [Lactarius psammicola]|nr:hypothetical protein BJY52DRAFT_1229915 [Lactarius psammicola]
MSLKKGHLNIVLHIHTIFATKDKSPQVSHPCKGENRFMCKLVEVFLILKPLRHEWDVSEPQENGMLSANEIGETGSSPGSKSNGASSQVMPTNNSEVSLHSSHRVMIPWLSACIKKEKIKTCWFMLWSKRAITKPPVSHMSVQLELGDLFINQFHSMEHGAHVLQVWLLVMESIGLLHDLVMPNSEAKIAKSEKYYGEYHQHNNVTYFTTSYQARVSYCVPMEDGEGNDTWGNKGCKFDSESSI